MSDEAPRAIWVWGPEVTGFSSRGYAASEYEPSVRYVRADLLEQAERRLREQRILQLNDQRVVFDLGEKGRATFLRDPAELEGDQQR